MHIIEENQDVKYGGFWVRFVALIIDWIVLFFIQSLLNYVFTGNLMVSYEEGGSNTNYFVANILSIIVGVAYFAGMHSSSKQATIGKMCFDLKVVRTDGSRISFLRGVGRYFSKIISAIPLLFGFIMAGFTKNKQALHDKIADTLVIYDQN